MIRATGKYCEKCGEHKKFNRFKIDVRKPDGRMDICKECLRKLVEGEEVKEVNTPMPKIVRGLSKEEKKRKYISEKWTERDGVMGKVCTCPLCKDKEDPWVPISEFHKNKSAPDGVQSWCKEGRAHVDSKRQEKKSKGRGHRKYHKIVTPQQKDMDKTINDVKIKDITLSLLKDFAFPNANDIIEYTSEGKGIIIKYDDSSKLLADVPKLVESKRSIEIINGAIKIKSEK